MQQEIIRYLGKEERARTRFLYETCFPEDSGAFVEYYYQTKILDNRILVMEGADGAEDEEGWPQVMLHLNPYVFRFGRENISLNYIVAVAAAPAVRGQGKMFRVMRRALKDLAVLGHPFTFLIPADPRMYRSSGFALLPEESMGKEEAVRKESMGKEEQEGPWEGSGIPEGGPRRGRIRVEPVSEEVYSDAAAFANERLACRYDLFPLWSREYLKRMVRELAAQEGGLLAARDYRGGEPPAGDLAEEPSGRTGRTDVLVGLATYGREKETAEWLHFLAAPGQERRVDKAFRESLFQKGIRRLLPAAMPVMVRILDLQRLMELLGGVCREEFRLRVLLRDELIHENNGCFELCCREGRGSVRRISKELVEREMDISELAAFLFGKMRMYLREWV